MKTKRKKLKKFCRLYKYTCTQCQKVKHKRHYAKQGETVCPKCSKLVEQSQVPNLFD